MLLHPQAIIIGRNIKKTPTGSLLGAFSVPPAPNRHSSTLMISSFLPLNVGPEYYPLSWVHKSGRNAGKLSLEFCHSRGFHSKLLLFLTFSVRIGCQPEKTTWISGMQAVTASGTLVAGYVALSEAVEEALLF